MHGLHAPITGYYPSGQIIQYGLGSNEFAQFMHSMLFSHIKQTVLHCWQLPEAAS